MFFPSAIPKKRYWTLLISENSLMVAKLDNNGKKLAFYEELALPAGLIVRNEIKDPEKLAAILSQIKEKLKITDKFIVVGIPEDQCLNHALTLPSLNNREIEEAIAYQSDSFLPFPYQKECVDWMLVGTLPDGKKKVLVSAIPKNIIEGYISVLEKTGFHPIAFESASLSLFRLVPEVERKVNFAMSINKNSIIIILLKENAILTSSLVSEQKDIPVTIKKILDYYLAESEKKENPLKIFLCGDSLSAPLSDQITQLGLKIINLDSGIQDLPPLLSSLLNKTVEHPRDEKTINIIPEDQLVKYDNTFREKGSKKIIRILLSFIIFLNLITAFAYYRLLVNINNLARNITLTESELRDLEKLESFSNRTFIIKKSSGQQNLFIEINTLIKSNVSLVNVRNINYSKENKELILSGQTVARENLFQFKDILEKKRLFTKVLIPLSSLEKDNNIDFRIICTL